MLVLSFRLVIAIHEYVSLCRVPMEITVEENISTFKCFLHHELCVIEDWVLFAAWSDPLSVQILAYQGAPIVADDDSVGVQHWYDLEDKCTTEKLCLLIIAYQKVDDTVHDEGRIRFTWMNTACEYDCFSVRDGLR